MGHRSVAGKGRTFSPMFYLYPLFIDDQFQKDTPCPCWYHLQKIAPLEHRHIAQLRLHVQMLWSYKNVCGTDNNMAFMIYFILL